MTDTEQEKQARTAAAVALLLEAASGRTVRVRKELVRMMLEELEHLMRHWRPESADPDPKDLTNFVCEMCCERAGQDGVIKHGINCTAAPTVKQLRTALGISDSG